MAPPVKRPSSRASKTQIFAAFDQLNSEYKKLAAAPKETTVPSASTPASQQNGHARADHTTVGQTIAALLVLRGGFGGVVSGLSSQLTAEASRLATLHQEVGDKTKLLAVLHEIEVGDGTLAALIQEHHDKSVAFERELSEKQKAATAEIEARTAAWRAEKEERARAVADRDELLKKARRRGAEEYEYDLAQNRKAEAGAYEQQRKAKETALEELVEAKNKAWTERERQCAAEEALHAEFKAKFDELPQRLEAAVKRAKGEGVAIASAQAKVKADLLAKEIDGDKRVFELRVKSLEGTIKERAQQIESLSAQLSAALKQSQDLAIKAIEGASNSSTFQAVKEIALEQAKNAPKAGR
jgi:hypothetical protein